MELYCTILEDIILKKPCHILLLSIHSLLIPVGGGMDMDVDNVTFISIHSCLIRTIEQDEGDEN